MLITQELLNTEKEARQFITDFPTKAPQYALNVLLCLIIFFIGLFLIKIVRRVVKRILSKRGSDENTVTFVDNFIKYTLLAILVGSISIKLGIEAAAIASLLASVGVAVGLAIQGSLANFAGGVLIIVLKPFKVGDYIIEGVKGREGKVIEISLIYTKILNYQNEVIILPNGTLANQDTVNLTANPYRRIDHEFSIAYDSDISKAKETLLNLAKNTENVLKKPEPGVVVSSLGESSVNLKLKVFVHNKHYWDVYHKLLEEGKNELDKAGISIPYNQLDVHVK